MRVGILQSGLHGLIFPCLQEKAKPSPILEPPITARYCLPLVTTVHKDSARASDDTGKYVVAAPLYCLTHLGNWSKAMGTCLRLQ